LERERERERERRERVVTTHLSVEVEESMRAVDIIERSKRHHRAIDEHGVKGQIASLGHCQPVRMAATHKHLKNILKKFLSKKNLETEN
jgi:hypothetical protein